jgi:hypothetical protein
MHLRGLITPPVEEFMHEERKHILGQVDKELQHPIPELYMCETPLVAAASPSAAIASSRSSSGFTFLCSRGRLGLYKNNRTLGKSAEVHGISCSTDSPERRLMNAESYLVKSTDYRYAVRPESEDQESVRKP